MTTKNYDRLIESATEQYLPDADWRLIKAQLIAESNLNTEVVSPAGAQGIAQFMPATWKEISAEMGYGKNSTPLDPELAIPACAYYMRKLWDQWTWKRPAADRYALALASYNAGFGNIIKAQKAASNTTDYATIIAALQHITGSHANETKAYVRSIYGYWMGMILEP